MSRRIDKLMTAHYAFIQVLVNSLYLSVVNFASFYLRSKGVSDAQIGFILATGMTISVLTQPYIGSLADRSMRIGLNQMMALFMGGVAVLAVFLFVAEPSAMILAVVYVVFNYLMGAMWAFVNSLAVEQINRGVNVNFGLARGIGSGGYAAASLILGQITASMGEESVMATIAILGTTAVVALALFGRRSPGEGQDAAAKAQAEAAERAKKGKAQKLLPFVRSNPRFCVYTVGVALMFFCHLLRGNYMYQIALNVGCTVDQYGTISAFTAIVEIPAMFGFALLLKKFKARTLMLFSSVCLVFRTIVVALAGNLFWLYVGQSFQSVSYALFVPASVYFVNEWIGSENSNKGQSFLGIGQQISSILASLFGGLMLTANNGNPRSMLLTATAISAVGLVLVFGSSPKMEK